MPDPSDKFKNDESSDRFSWVFKEISNAEGNEFEVKCWLLSAMNLYKDELELKCKLFFCLLKSKRFNQNDIYAKEVFEESTLGSINKVLYIVFLPANCPLKYNGRHY